MPNITPEMTRPVRCAVCNEQMHYASRPGHEPEVQVTVRPGASTPTPRVTYYVHLRCWEPFSEHLTAHRIDDRPSYHSTHRTYTITQTRRDRNDAE